MKPLHRIIGAGLFLAAVVLLTYSTGATGNIKNLHANIEKSTKLDKPAQPDSTQLRVKLNVTVFDSSNRPAADINSEEFQVFEDGIPQRVTSVAQQNGPVSLGLLVDCSGSLRSQISTMMRAGRAIISNMKPEDEAFVIRFVSHDNINLVQDWTSNRAKLHSKIDDMYPEGGQSAIIDAVYLGAQRIAERKKLETSPHRYALVLITDGEDRISYYNLEQLLKLLRDSDLQIFVIGLPEALKGQKAQEKAIGLLNTLANETGGRVFLIDGKLEPSESGLPPDSVARGFYAVRKLEFDQIIAEIVLERDAQYVIAYDSTHGARDGSFRKVRVTIKDKVGRDKRVALTRPGYTVPGK